MPDRFDGGFEEAYRQDAERGMEPIDLRAKREEGLSERQVKVLRAIQAGSDCQLCGDLGAQWEASGVGVPCCACGRVGSDG